ncbi:Ameiotic-like protein [Thalictrum thalictroides]|uniref:Ameiotic-like protein n=1 Tax=Thalictrum thalictroides TaxID=46969 RepID=A0A7J6WKJ6_THATH|nr:Ameiotic-like protein [Thalictrum thalictroides]
METNLCKQGYAPVAAGAIDVTVCEIKCFKRRNSRFEESQKPSLGRHVLSSVECSIANNVELKVGFLYEIDHKLLPPKSPIQLKSIRVAMVTEKNELNITVRFPSMLALRVYFSGGKSQAELANLPENKNPDLDEQYVMGAKLAKEILFRLISPAEFQEQGRFQSFWLVPSKISELSTLIIKDGNASDETSVQGLNCDGMLNWGVRKRISFMARHYSGSKTPRAASSSSSLVKEEDIQKEVTTVEETKRVLRKRKRKGVVKPNKKSKVARREEKKKPSSKTKRQKLKLSYDRWSRDRYKNAEVKMLEIMKEKGAVVGRPMLRPTLRLEARKHIGDTGLLDHLLKHMAGKIAPNGEDRFRRRHNADGAMEYWLENADLVNVRKEAGVNDPFWIPPPGWKPGDSLLAQDSNTCVVELKLLKEEMASIKKNVEEILLSKKDQDNGDKAIVPFTKSSSENSNLESDNKLISSLEGYESLMKRKTELEQELLQISQSLKGFQNEKRSCDEKGAELEEPTNNTAKEISPVEKDKTAVMNEEVKRAEERAERRERLRSGFRICKPQGTFLWPSNSSAGNSSSTNVLSPHQVLVPTPPSVTSANTSAPRLFLPPPPPSASPVEPLPLAEKPPVIKIPISSSSTSYDHGDKVSTTNTSLHLHPNQLGFRGTPSPTSCSAHQQRTAMVLPSTTVTHSEGYDPRSDAMEYSSSSTKARTYQRKQQERQQQDPYFGRTWLALGTPNSSLSNDTLF